MRTTRKVERTYTEESTVLQCDLCKNQEDFIRGKYGTYDVPPLGWVFVRVSSDIDNVDNTLHFCSRDCLVKYFLEHSFNELQSTTV